MKTLSAIASLLLFVTMQNCNAGLTGDLIGRWTGTEKTNNDGEKIKSSVTTVYERFQDRGFIINSTVRSPGLVVRKKILRCYDSGKIEGAFIKGGQTSGLVVGTWKITDRKLTIKLKVSTLGGKYQQTTRTILIGPRKTSAVVTDSTGTRGIVTMRKK